MKIDELKILAKEAAENAYAPFSKFNVGCAIHAKSGEVYTGCNVESKSLTFNICAERNAISSAVSKAGDLEIDKVVIYTPTPKAVPPCGLCRQLIFEFGKDARVISFSDSADIIDTTIQELLPSAFDFDKQ